MTESRPFTPPRVIFQEQLPVLNSQAASIEAIREIHLQLLNDSITAARFFSEITQYTSGPEVVALAVSSAVTSFLIIKRPYPPALPIQLATLISGLMLHPSEPVRRTCLTLLTAASDTSSFRAILLELSNRMENWPRHCQDLFFAFAFSFDGNKLSGWSALRGIATRIKDCDDTELALTATDFLSWIGSNGDPRHCIVSSSLTVTRFKDIIKQEEEPLPQPIKRASSTAEESIKQFHEDHLEVTRAPPTELKTIDIDDYSQETFVPEQPPHKPMTSPKPKRTKKELSPRAKTPPEETENPVVEKTLSNYVDDLRDEDWEIQQAAVQKIQSILQESPELLALYAHKVWMNMLDTVQSPRTVLLSQVLALANSFFEYFSSKLVAYTAQWITQCLNLVCNNKQFIADAAGVLIDTISKQTPRSRTLPSFVAGTKHKNPLARMTSASCMKNLIIQGSPTEKEMKSFVGCLVPLMSDGQAATRENAKVALQLLVGDERFNAVLKNITHSPQEYTQIKRSLA